MAAIRPLGIRSGLVATGGIMPGDLMMLGESISAGAIATVGAGTLTGAALVTGIIRRTGPVGGYTDTTDTADNIIAALAGNWPAADLVSGSSWRVRFINTVAQAMTFAAGVGVRAGTGTLDVAASLVRDYLFTVLNAARAVTLTANTTNGSPTVTFVFPSGQVAWTMGPAVGSINIGAGMTLSGTGVTAGTRALSITQGAGGVTGLVMDANATATGTISLLISPTILVDSLGAGTL